MSSDDLAERLAAATHGRYRIAEMLGAGGMGEVFLAHDDKLSRQVCIKVILADDDDDSISVERRERFYREAKALAALNHPGIVKIIDYGGKDEALPFIVMERLEGQTLEAFVDLAPLPEAVSYALAFELLSALEHAHAAGILHRDLKPSNIFLEPTGRSVLIDFGLAKGLRVGGDRKTFRISHTQLVGSPLFASPEQATGGALSPRSDVFGLGAVLYHAVSQVYPFRGENVPQVIAAVVSAAPVPLGDLVEINPEFWALVSRMLAKDPAARPTTSEAKAILSPLLLAQKIAAPSEVLGSFVNGEVSAKPLLARSVAVADTLELPQAETQVGRQVQVGGQTQITTAPSARGRAQPRLWHWLVLASLLMLGAAAAFRLFAGNRESANDAVLVKQLPADNPPPAANSAGPTTPPAGGVATLRLIVKPWGSVSIDGEARGLTPAFRFAPLSLGKHEVVVSNPSFGERRVVVELKEANTEMPLVVDFAKP